MERTSPYGRFARKVHEGPPRRGVRGMLQRMARAVVPRPVSSSLVLIEAPAEEGQPSRERARRALMEARRTMSGVIGEASVPIEVAGDWPVQAVMPDLERLQRYLEESDRDREALRTEVIALRESVNALRAQLDHFERLLPPPAPSAQNGAPDAEPGMVAEGTETAPASEASEGAPPEPVAAAEPGAAPVDAPGAEGTPEGTSTGDEPSVDAEALRELRERVLRAVRERTFAAGTVGTRVFLSPPPTAEELEGIVARLNEEPLAEHAEVIESGDGAASVRVSLRTPLRWEQFSSLIERAVEQPLLHSEVAWSDGALHVQLGTDDGGGAVSEDADITTPSMPDGA